MGSSPESLRTSLEQYESQLAQTEAALVDCTDAMTKLHLYALQEDLLQLISLTKESLSALNPASESSEDNTIQNNINENDDGSACVSDSPSNAQDELANLPGSKCQAPYVYKNGDDIISYHNALVLSIEDRSENTKFEDIMVRVMFVNPTCSEMLPCPFYLEGKCKFDDNKCRYSHGELVHFARLKEFKEPDFTLIKPNALVLAKGTDGIWHRGAIVSLITDDTKCVVKFESVYQPVRTLDIHEVLPLVGGADYAEETTDSDTFDSDCGLNVPDRLPEHLVKRDLFTLSPSQQFGAWEQHTKSIGSKLMARMGYVAGTGLGKNATGILQPVSASILPFGKSLDYCMALREASGGDPNLFNVEKLQKQLQEKEANLRQRQHQRYEKRKSQKNVFSFINRAIATDSRSYLENPSTSSGSRNSEISLKDSSERVLNIEKLKVDDDIRKREKDISHLYLTLSKLPKASNLYNYLEKKMIKAQNELRHLQQKESNITKEKSFRETKKQMTTF